MPFFSMSYAAVRRAKNFLQGTLLAVRVKYFIAMNSFDPELALNLLKIEETLKCA